MEKPSLIKTIPAQIINELAAYGPFNLKDYIQALDQSPLTFSAELTDGTSLPKGMICTADGILTGIPAKGTEGNYEIVIHAMNEAGEFSTIVNFTIKPSPVNNVAKEYFDKLKAQVWEAMDKNLPVPDLQEMLDHPITPLEFYYLLERWGALTMWDAFNLDAPGEKKLLNLKGASPHYNVFDRGSCIISAPKDLFSNERTIEDSLMTARAMAREVFERHWTVEMAGIGRLTRAAWVEIQHLGDLHGRRLEVLNFTPTPNDVKLYHDQAIQYAMLRGKT